MDKRVDPEWPQDDPPRCSLCGLTACDCADLAALVATPPLLPVTVAPNPCPVCHRNKRDCVCASHAVHRERSYDVKMRAGARSLSRPFSPEYVEALVQEGLHHYYGRDAEGLERWLRQVLP